MATTKEFIDQFNEACKHARLMSGRDGVQVIVASKKLPKEDRELHVMPVQTLAGWLQDCARKSHDYALHFITPPRL